MNIPSKMNFPSIMYELSPRVGLSSEWAKMLGIISKLIQKEVNFRKLWIIFRLHKKILNVSQFGTTFKSISKKHNKKKWRNLYWKKNVFMPANFLRGQKDYSDFFWIIFNMVLNWILVASLSCLTSQFILFRFLCEYSYFCYC